MPKKIPAELSPRLPLTFGLEVTLFTALKDNFFGHVPHGTITHLLVERLRQHRLSGPQGCGSKICAAVARLDSYPIHELVDYDGWTLASTPLASADHPEWFETCERRTFLILILNGTVADRLVDRRNGIGRDYIPAVLYRFPLLGVGSAADILPEIRPIQCHPYAGAATVLRTEQQYNHAYAYWKRA